MQDRSGFVPVLHRGKGPGSCLMWWVLTVLKIHLWWGRLDNSEGVDVILDALFTCLCVFAACLGRGGRSLAIEVVRTGMYLLLQVRHQVRCLELWGHAVGGAVVWRQALLCKRSVLDCPPHSVVFTYRVRMVGVTPLLAALLITWPESRVLYRTQLMSSMLGRLPSVTFLYAH